MEDQIEKEKKFNEQMESLYNMIIKINSMEQLTKEGWKVINKENNKTQNKTKENKKDEKKEEKKVSIISVLGNKNVGKSFILHLLTGKNIPNGYTVTTEGLSFITPDEKSNKSDDYMIIDTAGTESPILDDDPKKLNEETKKKMAKDRQITDYFIQKFILEKSDIFICVVDNLTLSNQKFINRIIKNYTYKTIFIIHNLKTFIEKDQVENYINKTLLQSLTFHLEKDEYFNIESDNEKSKENQFFFKQKLKKNERIIVHLIIANKESEAGGYYNQSTINYLKNQLSQVKEKKSFDILKNIEEFLISFSEEIFSKKLEKSALKFENNCIKIMTEQEMQLKDCLIDELGNNIIKDNQYKPKHRYGYFIDSSCKERKFFLEIELFGKWKLKQKVEIAKDFFFLIINGEKEKEIKKKTYEFSNYLPGNEFELKLKIENSKGIVNNNNPQKEIECGLYTLIFSLYKRKIEEEFVNDESEEEEDV